MKLTFRDLVMVLSREAKLRVTFDGSLKMSHEMNGYDHNRKLMTEFKLHCMGYDILDLVNHPVARVEMMDNAMIIVLTEDPKLEEKMGSLLKPCY